LGNAGASDIARILRKWTNRPASGGWADNKRCMVKDCFGCSDWRDAFTILLLRVRFATGKIGTIFLLQTAIGGCQQLGKGVMGK